MEIRKEVFYAGNLPFAATLPQVESFSSLHWVLRKLIASSTRVGGKCFVELPILASLLEIPDTFAKVLADTVAAVAPADHEVRSGDAVDCHAVVLYLVAQQQQRASQRTDAKDIWPSSGSSSGPDIHMPQLEPSSPVRMSTKASMLWPTNFVRQHLQQQVALQAAQVAGFAEYAQRHAVELLLACLDQAPPDASQLTAVAIAPHEFDRLGFLLQAQDGRSSNLSALQPALREGSPAALLAVSSALTVAMKEGNRGPAHACVETSGTTQIQGVCKNTVAKGAGAFPSGRLRIVDCHDATIYALAPLQCVSVSCCSDCTVVVGAVGALLRVERCMRVQVIAATKRMYVNASHDCIFYLGVNERPVLLGDNRFVQFAPYNTHYDRLGAHMAACGCTPTPNLWDSPLLLLPDHATAHADLLKSPDGKSASARGKGGPAYSILPPDKLMPCVVPFKGGPGKLCGGPAGSIALLRSDSLGSSAGPDGRSAGSCPFALPPAYEAAVNSKIESVAQLRMAVKSANLPDERKREVQSVIQSYFREWLNSSGKMRQIYDLARLEKDADL